MLITFVDSIKRNLFKANFHKQLIVFQIINYNFNNLLVEVKQVHIIFLSHTHLQILMLQQSGIVGKVRYILIHQVDHGLTTQ